MVGTIELIELAVDGAVAVIAGLRRVIADAQQRGELTDEQFAALNAKIDAQLNNRAWKTDAELDAGAGAGQSPPSAVDTPPTA